MVKDAEQGGQRSGSVVAVRLDRFSIDIAQGIDRVSFAVLLGHSNGKEWIRNHGVLRVECEQFVIGIENGHLIESKNGAKRVEDRIIEFDCSP